MKYLLIISIAAVALLFSRNLNAQTIDHWESVITEGDSWKYFLPTAEPPSSWKDLSFDDSSWQTGNSGFGYGDNDDNTIIPNTVSLYLRKKFDIADISAIEEWAFHMDYDDAFVAYLNGIEIARSGISGNPPAFNQTAEVLHEALLYQGQTPEKFIGDQSIQSLLGQGENVLAIQVHNQDINSSDLTAIPFLLAGINNSSITYSDLPSWYLPNLEFSSSDIPILVINTNGQPIQDEPKIMADIGIVNNGSGVENNLSDPFNEFSGFCGIEIRGESSQFFAKKSYGIEIWDSSGADIDTSFLDFPSEEDFVLHGPYSDKSLMNNVLAMKIANDMGQYASRTRFVELVLNGDYQGVYVVMERIKRDNERVDISRLEMIDISGDQLTGGYIIRIDKGENDGWLSDYNAYQSDRKIFYQYVYPDQDQIQPQQKNYIQSYVDQFESAVASPSQVNSTGKHYLEYIDLRSFVDNFILNELSKNVDAYRLSTYFHKDRDSKGGKLTAGPVWDYNLAFGNGDYCGGDDTTGWEYYQCVGSSPFWWDTMLQHSDFTDALRCRWEELRQTTLSTDYINNYLDSLTTYLDGARSRNFQKWPVMGIYLWPNSWFYASAANHDEIMGYMKGWIEERSLWLDDNIPGIANECDRYEPPYYGLLTSIDETDASLTFNVYPNPASSHLFIESLQIIREIKLINSVGQTLYHSQYNSKDIQIDVNMIGQDGIFILHILTDQGLSIKKVMLD